jgi:hypothetical protein
MVRLIPLMLAVLLVSAPVAADVLAPEKASQIVQLRQDPDGGANCALGSKALDHRVLPDGTIVPFTIPQGRVLVLTGVSWLISSLVPNIKFGVLLELSPEQNVTIPLFAAAAESSGSGQSAGSALIPNAVVKAGARVCFALITQFSNVWVFGFLADDK